MPALDGSDTPSRRGSELEQHSQRSDQPLQQEVKAATLGQRHCEELSADGLGHNLATESRHGPEIHVNWEGNKSADSNASPAQKQPSKDQHKEDGSQMPADEGSTKLQPEFLHVNKEPEQEDGNAVSEGTERTAEFSDQGPRDTGDGQHAVKTSEECQIQPGDNLNPQVSGLKPLTMNWTESEGTPDHPAYAAETVALPENARLACSENGQQGDSPGADAEDLEHLPGRSEMAIETEAVQQSRDDHAGADEAGMDLRTLQAAETRASSVQGDDSDNFSLDTVAGSGKPERLGLKAADECGSEQQPAKEEFSFSFPTPKDPDQARSPAGLFTSSGDNSTGSFTLKSRLPALLAAAAGAEEGLPGASQHRQEQLPVQRPMLKGAADISDEWNKDDDSAQQWSCVEAKQGPKVLSTPPNFGMPALAGKAGAPGPADSAGQPADLGKGVVDFDDLPVMRKKPRRKTKDTAAPGAAADGQPGSSTEAAALVSESNGKPESNGKTASSSSPIEGDQAVSCEQCSFSAVSALLLDRHQRVEHPFGQQGRETFECELCGVQAGCRETFRSHLLGRPHAMKERAMASLQALRRMEETVRPNSERADLARRLQEPGGMPHIRTSLPPACGTCLMEETASSVPLPRSLRKALAGPRAGPASEGQSGLTFADMPSRPRRARNPPSAESSVASLVVARPRPKSLTVALPTKSVSAMGHLVPTTKSVSTTSHTIPAAGSSVTTKSVSIMSHPIPAAGSSVTTKIVPTMSHPIPAAGSSARPTWSSHGSGLSAVSGTGSTFTRLSAASVRSLFQCPLAKELMMDPVVCPDGHTYEREAIEEYLSKHGKSPLTGQPIPIGVALAPNRLVRQAAAEAGISMVDLRPKSKRASTSSAGSSSAAL